MGDIVYTYADSLAHLGIDVDTRRWIGGAYISIREITDLKEPVPGHMLDELEYELLDEV